MKRVALFVLAIIVLLSGCHPPPSNLSQQAGAVTPRQLTIMMADISRSTIPIRPAEMMGVFKRGMHLSAPGDTMRLIIFGHTQAEVLDGLPTDRDHFALLIAKEMKPSDPQPGTDYAAAISRMADTAENTTTPEIRCVIYGDCADDYKRDPASLKRYHAAVERLNRNPRITFIRFVGPDAGTREELRTLFKPLGAKLQLMTFEQDAAAL